MHMTELDEAFEKVLKWKANKMVAPDNPYPAEFGASANDPWFRVAAIDAMVFDFASMVGFTKKTREHLDWASYPVRRWFLKKLFGNIIT
jgi:hypothetical protein